MDMPMDYHVWAALVERRYQRYAPEPTNNVDCRAFDCFFDDMDWFSTGIHWWRNPIILQLTLIVCCCSCWTFAHPV